MKRSSILLLLAAFFMSTLAYAGVAPPEGPGCPCNIEELPDGTTGLEILAEVCPGGNLAENGTAVIETDEIAVSIPDPFREFRVEESDLLFCSITKSLETVGALGLTVEQFENCALQLVLACSLTDPRPIPTLSQWGLIALAGVLGVLGFVAIRKKKAAA